jgi:flagellar hook-associated protein 3 FlgL
MTTSISTYGFLKNTVSNNNSLQRQMSELQQQIATGVKSRNYKGYNVDSLRLQNSRIELASIEQYIFNGTSSQSKIGQMLLGLEEIETQTDIAQDAISLLPQEGDVDITNLTSLSGNAKDLVQNLLNTKIGNDYIFAGSDINTAPIGNTNDLTSRIQSQISQWLDGTNTVDEFLENINAYTDSQVGYTLGVQSSTKVLVRADDNFEVDYTVKANEQGLRDIIIGLTAISEIKLPEEGVDVATRDDFFKIIDTVAQRLQEGINDLRSAQIKLASADASIGKKLQNLQTDSGYLQTTVENIQAVDPAEAVVRFQSLQTTLEASFQATSIISSLSLARFL